jgi:hypothetical protein
MAQCKKCSTFLPPGFVLNEDPMSGNKLICPTCVFCLKDVKVINYGDDRKQVTKRELEKEYKEFLSMVKANSEILKKGATGKSVIPGSEKFTT